MGAVSRRTVGDVGRFVGKNNPLFEGPSPCVLQHAQGARGCVGASDMRGAAAVRGDKRTKLAADMGLAHVRSEIEHMHIQVGRPRKGDPSAPARRRLDGVG